MKIQTHKQTLSPPLVIINGQVLLPDGRLVERPLLMENGRITGLRRGPRSADTLDAQGGLVVPGLIDLHAHGLGFESTAGSLADFARLESTFGATTFFPTFFGSADETAASLQRHLRETDNLRDLPQVGGFRLESPYLARTGAGLKDNLTPISSATTQRLLRAGKGWIRIWDISPELSGAATAIRSLARAGVLCSLAHTDATIEQARAAVDAGARMVTHLFDTFVVPKMTDGGVYPVGLIDYFLVEDRVACEIIPDGTHVHALHVEKTLRCKPAGSVMFVTDSNYGAGLPPGDHDLPQRWGRARINGPNNGVRLIDRNMGLAGSALTPIDGFRNTVQMFGQSLAAASRLCSTNPARLLDLNKGEIAAGRDADVIVLNPQLELQHTVTAGRILFSRAAGLE